MKTAYLLDNHSNTIFLLTFFGQYSALVMCEGSLNGVDQIWVNKRSFTLQKKDIIVFISKTAAAARSLEFWPFAMTIRHFAYYSQNNENRRQLVLCNHVINGGKPVFLDINNHQQVVLFSRYNYSAAICSED